MSEEAWWPSYTPDIDDLEYVRSFEKSDESYQFDITQVMFSDSRGAYFVGHDSGCSCPTPFEDFRTVADWGQPLTAAEARQKVLDQNTVQSCMDAKRRCADYVMEHAKARSLW